MTKAGDVNRAMVNRVAECLGPLRQKVVFLGGAATGWRKLSDPWGLPSQWKRMPRYADG